MTSCIQPDRPAGSEPVPSDNANERDLPCVAILHSDPDVRARFELLLQSTGHRVEILTDFPTRSFDAVTDAAIDLLLVELFRPEFDGIELLRELSSQPCSFAVAVLIDSQSGIQRSVAKAALHIGAKTIIECDASAEAILDGVCESLA